MTTYRLFPATNGPASAVNIGAGNFIAGVVFTVSQGCWFTGYWWWVAASVQSTAPVKCALWSPTSGGTGVLVSGSVVTSGTLTANSWNYIPLSTPIQLAQGLDPSTSTNGSAYIAAIGLPTSNASFPDTNHFWGPGEVAPGGITFGPLHAYSGTTGTSPAPWTLHQGVFTQAGSDPSLVMPNGASNTDNFWADVQVQDTVPAGYTGTYRLWPNKSDANPLTSTDIANPYVVATEVRLSQACMVNKVWYYSPSSAASLATWAGVYSITGADAGTLMAAATSPSWSGAAASGWVSTAIPGGVTLPAGHYKVAVYNSAGGGGGWSAKDADSGYFTGGVGSSGITWGPLFAPQTSAGSTAYLYNSAGAGNTPPYSGLGTQNGQPTFAISPGSVQYPYLYAPVSSPVAASSQNYWVDLEVTPVSGSGLLMASGII